MHSCSYPAAGWLPEGRLEIAIGIENGISGSVCTGTHHARADLKPANILLSSTCRAKLSDFGCALAEGGEALSTYTTGEGGEGLQWIVVGRVGR